MDKVRVLRIIEYAGDRNVVEDRIERSIHGTYVYNGEHGRMTIRAATIGNYPEILEPETVKDEQPDKP